MSAAENEAHDEPLCGADGPRGLNCTRLESHEGHHATRDETADEPYQITWKRYPQRGEE